MRASTSRYISMLKSHASICTCFKSTTAHDGSQILHEKIACRRIPVLEQELQTDEC